ncbi:putative LRR receptor-like serine/threonine-protein kinase [Dorcoceras hygrometricum]|uniref:Putative LRR receptor-like serine/threonine-protein kinase n=1 Tax=Dorcoceras hygrometricum TaxID=472368 RepID=A0A2Z7BCY0_9LAMI|nr:putative LRR receptor-like serine/threonine-protein kinase [Dorcoceras hygrometricum]
MPGSKRSYNNVGSSRYTALAVGPQPLWLRNHNSGLAQRIKVKRLETSPPGISQIDDYHWRTCCVIWLIDLIESSVVTGKLLSCAEWSNAIIGVVDRRSCRIGIPLSCDGLTAGISQIDDYHWRTCCVV